MVPGHDVSIQASRHTTRQNVKLCLSPPPRRLARPAKNHTCSRSPRPPHSRASSTNVTPTTILFNCSQSLHFRSTGGATAPHLAPSPGYPAPSPSDARALDTHTASPQWLRTYGRYPVSPARRPSFRSTSGVAPAAARWVPPPIPRECSANSAGGSPTNATTYRSAATAWCFDHRSRRPPPTPKATSGEWKGRPA